MESQSLKQYKKLGYTTIKNFLPKDKLKKMNTIIDNLDLPVSDTVFDESGTGKIKQIQYLYNYDAVFRDLLVELKPIAENLIGTKDLEVLNMQLFEKHPQISKPTRAHQDNAYFKVSPPHAITIWIALDDMNEDNGCLYYAPYTHLTPTRIHQRYHPHTTFRMRSGVPGLSLCLHEHPSECDEPMICSAGDVNIHNCNTIHRAGKNSTINKRRRAIGVVYIPTYCKQDDRLVKYHNDRLREDIELQQVKDPLLHKELMEQFSYLFQ